MRGKYVDTKKSGINPVILAKIQNMIAVDVCGFKPIADVFFDEKNYGYDGCLGYLTYNWDKSFGNSVSLGEWIDWMLTFKKSEGVQ
jgi:hypothetical protein